MDFKWKYQFNGILPRRKTATKEQNMNEVLKEKLPYQIVFKHHAGNDSQTWIGRKLAGVNDSALSQFIKAESNSEQPQNLQFNTAGTSAAQQRVASLKYPDSMLPVVISRQMSLCYAVYFGMILSRPVDLIIASVSLIQYIIQSRYIQSKKLKLLVLPGQL
ncbi:hypothetical protein MP228_009351 [Amoeboaphelidium protococcarum]|nr:hypothetical protein MP228_009351 [Amoeboaphelidium protococcarum]